MAIEEDDDGKVTIKGHVHETGEYYHRCTIYDFDEDWRDLFAEVIDKFEGKVVKVTIEEIKL